MMNTKILVPLATLLAAGAIAVGSGATFSSTTGNTISSVTSGTLTHSNSKDGLAIFTLADMKPGDILNGELTLTNTGSLPAKFSLTEVSSSNGFTGENLSLDIVDTTTGEVVYSGTFGGLADGVSKALGTDPWAPSTAHTFRFTVKLAQATTNVDQNKTATASYTWSSVQLDGETYPTQ